MLSALVWPVLRQCTVSSSPSYDYFKQLVICIRTDLGYFKGGVEASDIFKKVYSIPIHGQIITIKGRTLLANDIDSIQQHLSVLEDTLEDFQDNGDIQEIMSVIEDAAELHEDLRRRCMHLSCNQNTKLIRTIFFGKRSLHDKVR